MKKNFFVIIILNFIFFPVYSQNRHKIDSLKQLINNAREDTVKAKTLLELGNLYENIITDSSLFFYKKSLLISKAINNKDYIAKSYENIGNILYYKGNYDKSIDYYQKALVINENLNNKSAIAGNIGNIGNIYYYQKEYDRAIDFYKRALEIQKDNNDKKGMSYSNINIGNIYSIKNASDTALKYYKEALELQKKIKDNKGIALDYLDIGIAYENLKKYDTAINYYKKSLLIHKALNDQRGIAYSYLSLSVSHNKLKQHNKAIYYAEMALAKSIIIKSLHLQKDIYNNLSDIYRDIKQYNKSLEYKDSVILLNDSIFSIEKTKAITKIQTLYETEKKVKLILKQKNELNANKLQLLIVQSKKDKQQILLIILIIGVIFLLISTIVVYRLYKQRITANKKLFNANEELTTLLSTITEQTNIIKESEEKFKALVNSINDAIILVDNNEKITLWNNSAERIFGYTEHEVLSKNIHHLITPIKYRNIAHKSFAYFKETGKGNAINKTLELEGINSKGETFPIELSLSAIKLNNEWHAIGSVRDISKRKEQEIELLKGKKKIEELYENLMDNIKFAKTIQQALLPSETILNTMLKDYYLYYKPKDIVGGDFYFIEKNSNILTFAIADCTGHGVSGAFVSILGASFLYNIVNNHRLAYTGQILSLLRNKIKETFKAFGSNNNNGFDIALCKLDINTNVLQYSGAFRPLWIIRKDKFIEYKGTRTSIANCPREISFNEHQIQLIEGDLIYLFTDGFADQFGGLGNKKLKIKPLKKLLLEISKKNIGEQKKILIRAFTEWKGGYEQTDDVTFFCLKI